MTLKSLIDILKKDRNYCRLDITPGLSARYKTHNIGIKTSRRKHILLRHSVQHWNPSEEAIGQFGEGYGSIGLLLARGI
jgi:hypothetical protein